MELVAVIVGITSGCLLAYTWLGYYPLLKLLAKYTANREPLPPAEAELPYLSIIIAAYNEEAVIAGRISNLQELDYPAEKITVYIGCDGCSDETAAIARRAAGNDSRFRIVEFERNRGKATVLKELVALAVQEHPGGLAVFSDANSRFAADALRKLVCRFADERVGGVCGRLVFERGASPEQAADGKPAAGGRTCGEPPNAAAAVLAENPAEEGVYWRLETRLKELESRLDSCLGANGAIYAIRAELFPADFPGNTVVDDFVIGMKVREKGLRMLFDRKAVAFEELPPVADEWRRRVRIGAGDFQAMVICRRCLRPQYGIFALFFFCHKILRWFTAHLALLLLASGGILAAMAVGGLTLGGSDYLIMAAAAGVLLLIIAGMCGRLLRRVASRNPLLRLLAVCDHFVTMHAALFAGFLRFCSGELSGTWTRTPRR